MSLLLLDRLQEAATKVKNILPQEDQALQAALILGSGMSSLARNWPFKEIARLAYDTIPGLPQASVAGHAGELLILEVAPHYQIAVFCGRFHAYESHDLDAVVFPVRLAKQLGCSTLLLTNAAGGLAETLNPGCLMLLSDHINLTGLHPLRGANPEALGPRFYDMGEAYSKRLRQLMQASATKLGVALQEGVYAWVLGPSYETPAEIRMLATLGADAVGMSTVPEVLAARHMGLETLALSCITNKAAGLQQGVTLNHQEVIDTAKQVEQNLSDLLAELLLQLAKEHTESA